jgi:tRNA-specific adenosine deaminase 3
VLFFNKLKNQMISEQQQFPLSTHSPGALEVRSVQFDTEQHGRGVFATINIKRGTLVENAHAIRIEKDEYEKHISKTCLEHYVYTAPDKGAMLMVLGIGSLFNHADPPNLDYRIVTDSKTGGAHRVEYYAAKEIHAGDELCIYYGRAVWWEKQEEKNKQQVREENEQEALPFGGSDE